MVLHACFFTQFIHFHESHWMTDSDSVLNSHLPLNWLLCFHCKRVFLWSHSKHADPLPARRLCMYLLCPGVEVLAGTPSDTALLSERKRVLSDGELRLEERAGQPEFTRVLWKRYSLTVMFTWWLKLKESVNSTQPAWAQSNSVLIWQPLMLYSSDW